MGISPKIRSAYIRIPDKNVSCYWLLDFLCLMKKTRNSGDILLNLDDYNRSTIILLFIRK